MIAHCVSVKVTSHLATLNHSEADLGILKRQQPLEEPERRKIWKDEYEKISYLSSKLLKILNEGQKNLVYKRSSGLSLEDIKPLAEAIRKKGTYRLLYIEADPQGPVGKVQQVSEALFIGTIDKFAPYITASDCSYDVWNEIIQDMLSHSPPIAAEEMKQ